MANKPTLGIDLDNVLYPFDEQFRAFASDTLNRSLPIPQQWDLWHDWQITEAQFRAILRRFHVARGFLTGEPLPGAVETLRALSRQWHIVIVTSRGVDPATVQLVRDDSWDWLRRYEVPFDGIVFAQSKTGHGLHALIDDAEYHLRAVASSGMRAVCFDAAHNQGWRGERVRDWREAGRALDILASVGD